MKKFLIYLAFSSASICLQAENSVQSSITKIGVSGAVEECAIAASAWANFTEYFFTGALSDEDFNAVYQEEYNNCMEDNCCSCNC